MSDFLNYNNISIQYLGHASFLIQHKNYKIFIDPFQLKNEIPADLILVTHEHYDHCDKESIEKITKPETIIVAPKSISCKIDWSNIIFPKLNENLTINEVSITPVPAYNINKFRSPDQPYHPSNENYLGYLIKYNETTIYHAGDTDFIPEMASFPPIDIALLPIGGKYTMDAQEAIKAIEIIKPKITIPIHYNSLEALPKIDINNFVQQIDNLTNLVILTSNQQD